MQLLRCSGSLSLPCFLCRGSALGCSSLWIWAGPCVSFRIGNARWIHYLRPPLAGFCLIRVTCKFFSRHAHVWSWQPIKPLISTWCERWRAKGSLLILYQHSMRKVARTTFSLFDSPFASLSFPDAYAVLTGGSALASFVTTKGHILTRGGNFQPAVIREVNSTHRNLANPMWFGSSTERNRCVSVASWNQ